MKEKIKLLSSKYKLGDFFRNLLAVIIGIIITFIGNSYIERIKIQKEIRESLELVKSELLFNKREIEKIGKQIELEQRGAYYLEKHKRRINEIPTDSLNKYGQLPFQWNNFHYASAGIEMLKESALIQKIENKVFAFEIIKTYSEIQNIDNLFKIYTKYKDQARNFVNINPKAKTFTFNNNPNDLVAMWNFLFMLPEGVALIRQIQGLQDPKRYFNSLKQIDYTINLINKELTRTNGTSENLCW